MDIVEENERECYANVWAKLTFTGCVGWISYDSS